ncbi:hypothetical protein [Vibrio barjaei]|uniref:hypothetical protein n=1 Tax=Vibrio barjaei TaxID=1676683 RepID=UPI0007BB3335|nr:hypothetical protein [Vibrio barjaei]OIN24677.1 hypothetical protein AWH66_2019790 [Vibrio barjaei]
MMWGYTEEKLRDLIHTEKEHLWNKVNELSEQLKTAQDSLSELEKTAPEHFSKTVGNQRKTAEIKNRAKEQFEEMQKIAHDVESGKEFFESLRDSIQNSHEQSTENSNQIATLLSRAQNENEELTESKLESENTIQELRQLVDEKNLLTQRIETITEQVADSENLTKSLRTLLTGATKERKEIRSLYLEVFGQSYEDENGEIHEVEGLKEQLQVSFDKIKEDLTSLNSELSTLNETQTNVLASLETHFKESTDEAVRVADEQYTAIKNRINALLPTALTAGLSGAYVEKIKVEKEQLNKHEFSFFIAIIGLIICSSIPLIYSVVRVLFQEQEFVNVIKDTPTIFSLMLPVYAPILWVAYSSNKSYKLSKRLIEEYTHKEVSSKTFEGLSEQISQIGEDNASGELRTRLLFNLLQVNSENPGKLISDYNNSDHPIIDAIDKSSKLAEAINKLDNVPVVSHLLKHLSAKEKAKLDEKEKEAQAALDAHVEASKEQAKDNEERKLDS